MEKLHFPNPQNVGLKIFSGRAHPELAQKIVAQLKLDLGQTEFRDFSDGETWVKLGENIRGRDIFIIEPTCAPARNLIELLIMIDAARRASAMRAKIAKTSRALRLPESLWRICSRRPVPTVF